MADKKQMYGVLEGTLVYAKIAQPDSKFESKDTEYVISVIVDEDTADAWDEQFKKQPAKKVKASEFESKYKIELPKQLKGQKNVFEIKLKKDATKDGEPFNPEFRPKVFVDYDNGDRVEITESRLIANGSYGKVSYRINTNNYGTFARLNNILMTEEGFKEYVSTGGAAGSEFGEVKEVKKEAPRKEATQARTSKVSKQAEPEPEDDGDDQDVPF
jgi:hypothetical protein